MITLPYLNVKQKTRIIVYNPVRRVNKYLILFFYYVAHPANGLY